MIGLGAYPQHMKTMGKVTDHYGGPIGLAGKIIGLGADEIKAGIPGWSWFAIGALVGGATTYALRGKIEKVAGG
jgi:hypothetical protein